MEKKLFSEFKEWLEKERDITSNQTYIYTARRFQKSIQKPFKEISIEDIESYYRGVIKEGKKPNYLSSIYYHLHEFTQFLYNKQIISFTIKDTAIHKPPSQKARKAADKATPLSFTQVIKIRQMLHKRPLQLFTFELAYSYGLTLDELKQCHRENYNPKTHQLTVKDKKGFLKEVFLDTSLQEIIKMSDRILQRKERETYQGHFGDIRDIYAKNYEEEIELCWEDVMATRNKYFIRCPLCDEIFENIPKNWRVVAYKSYPGHPMLACINCAEKGEPVLD